MKKSVYNTKDEMVKSLTRKLRYGICRFVFVKKDGTTTERFGTMKKSFILTKVCGNGNSNRSANVIKFWDIEKCAFRCLCPQNLVMVY